MRSVPFGKRKNPRKVHGFQCDEKLWLAQGLLPHQLGINTKYVVIEHSLQLGNSAIDSILEDEKARNKLRDHLIYDHLLKPLLDPENPYDKRAIEDAKLLEVIRQEVDSIAEKITQLCLQ